MMNADSGGVLGVLGRFPPRRMLVPVDFSEPSFAAKTAAFQLARRWEAHVQLVHVMDDTPPGLLQGADAPRELRQLQDYYRAVEQRLEGLAEGYPDLSVRMEEGYPKAVLSELAAPETADIVVMGTHARQGLARFAMGSVAEGVARAARIPVLTVHRKMAADWPRRILVPMIFAEYADRALKYALRLAESLRSEVSVLYAPPEDADPKEAFKPLDQHLSIMLGESANIGRLVVPGPPAEIILRAVDRERFDLVVMAAHRKPFWERMVLGATAEKVIRHSPVPVLAIPSEAPRIARKSGMVSAQEAAL